MEQAERGLQELRDAVDTVITIPNERLLATIDRRTPLPEAFAVADDVLRQAIQGISDLILVPGLINLDFADVKTIMSGMGLAIMGTGIGEGEDRAVEAARAAISSPLLEDASVNGARGVIINVTGGPDISLIEVSEASSIIQEAAHEEANIIFGAVVDPKMAGKVKITVIATGFDRPSPRPSLLSSTSTPVDLTNYAELKQQQSVAGGARVARHDRAPAVDRAAVGHELPSPSRSRRLAPPRRHDRGGPARVVAAGRPCIPAPPVGRRSDRRWNRRFPRIPGVRGRSCWPSGSRTHSGLTTHAQRQLRAVQKPAPGRLMRTGTVRLTPGPRSQPAGTPSRSSRTDNRTPEPRTRPLALTRPRQGSRNARGRLKTATESANAGAASAGSARAHRTRVPPARRPPATTLSAATPHEVPRPARPRTGHPRPRGRPGAQAARRPPPRGARLPQHLLRGDVEPRPADGVPALQRPRRRRVRARVPARPAGTAGAVGQRRPLRDARVAVAGPRVRRLRVLGVVRVGLHQRADDAAARGLPLYAEQRLVEPPVDRHRRRRHLRQPRTARAVRGRDRRRRRRAPGPGIRRGRPRAPRAGGHAGAARRRARVLHPVVLRRSLRRRGANRRPQRRVQAPPRRCRCARRPSRPPSGSTRRTPASSRPTRSSGRGCWWRWCAGAPTCAASAGPDTTTCPCARSTPSASSRSPRPPAPTRTAWDWCRSPCAITRRSSTSWNASSAWDTASAPRPSAWTTSPRPSSRGCTRAGSGRSRSRPRRVRTGCAASSTRPSRTRRSWNGRR